MKGIDHGQVKRRRGINDRDKERRHKKKRHHEEHPDADEVSDDGRAAPTIDWPAVDRLVRLLVEKYGTAREELEHLFTEIDGGNRVDVRGLEDEFVKQCLVEMFVALRLRQSTSKSGMFRARSFTPKLCKSIVELVPHVSSCEDIPSLPTCEIKCEAFQPVIGPAMPPDFPHERRYNIDVKSFASEDFSASVDEDDSMFGPLPSNIVEDNEEEKTTRMQRDYAYREAASYRRQRSILEQQASSSREEWMTALPETHRNDEIAMLSRRSFSKSKQSLLTNSERTSWIESPAQRDARLRSEHLERQRSKKEDGKSQSDNVARQSSLFSSTVASDDRPISLVHRHQALLQEENCRKTDDPRKVSAPPPRGWDRDRDLIRRPVGKHELSRGVQDAALGLHSRFG